MKDKYYNRDLSWILFDNRVIDQAFNKKIPLLEKLRFLSIASNNLDEFFGVRLHNVQTMISKNRVDKRTGLNGTELLAQIYEFNSRNITKEYQALGLVLEELKEKNIFEVTRYYKLSSMEKAQVDDYYDKVISNEIKVEEFSPENKTKADLNFLLVSDDKNYTIQVPEDLDRLVDTGVPDKYILLEDLIFNNLEEIIQKFKITKQFVYRVTYDKNKKYDFLDKGLSDEKYLSEMTNYINDRGPGKITRVEFYSPEHKGRSFLSGLFGISKKSIYAIPGPVNLKVLDKLFKKYKNNQKLVFPAFEGLTWKKSKNILRHLDNKSLLVQYPYDSFEIFLNFLNTAVDDPKTTNIQMTIYRTEKNSQVVKLLQRAASKGISVKVVVELRARFDEAHNLEVAKELKDSGCRVLYGDKVNKVHAKICLVLQNDRGYVQIGTGNYNAITSKVFSDISFYTSNKRYVGDAVKFFDGLSGEISNGYELMTASPDNLKRMILNKIKKATQDYLRNGKGSVFMKVNGLTDIDIINGIYRAARLGLPFSIIVRGPCSLRLGICGQKENIVVKSIVGELLEHSRIYKFNYSDGTNEVWISSADTMTRNLDRRVELAVPIVESKPKRKINKLIEMYCKDTTNSYYLNNDGEYFKCQNKFYNFSAQQNWLRKIKYRKYV
ncbi:polyphosphate kinase 1 [Companilactobacillus allii]|uniref:Polyphosphate kinase n=1 Tax=Companilactobacillus allii TaxID=1847728 RepID=A0A1P8Q5N0_9LACO|nr:polyphosphate kinase 1 [Companilactobacillus allii]APX73166.1 polyphosphate kinase 1 [Companilactobacillus allii]USQ67973.1 polyphosphate kinase 1 [Companilactobacillus allii]